MPLLEYEQKRIEVDRRRLSLHFEDWDDGTVHRGGEGLRTAPTDKHAEIHPVVLPDL
jgi:hypothetical protein